MHSAMADKQAALVHLQAGRNREAAQLFRNIVTQNRKDAECWYYLGVSLARLGVLGQSEAALVEATRINSRFGQALYWLGKVRYYQNKLLPAIDAYRKAIKRGCRRTEVWNELGKAQEQLGEYTNAENSFRAAIRQSARDDAAYANLARVLHHQGKQENVDKLYRKALDLNPSNLKAALGYYLSLPIIYEGKDHLLSCRRHYEEGVVKLAKEVNNYLGSKTRFNNLLARDGFYLAYQGFDDREVQARFAEFYRELLGRARPQFMQPMEKRAVAGRRIRVGYLSHYFHHHTVSYYFGDWITRADRDRFEIYVYHLDPVQDKVSAEMRAACDVYKPISGQLSTIAQEIKDDVLDILVYPEIGMYPRHMWLGAFRLAPVQCMAWGHPVTTGLSSIDYFLSADATEPANGDEHYSEQLIRLHGMGVSCSPVQPGNRGARGVFGLPEDRRLYLCSQSLFKIHVDMDELFAFIAVRDPQALILFFRDGKLDVDRVFQRRIARVFECQGLDPEQYVRFMDRVAHEDYLKLSALVDVMLDTMHFSGGRTSLDAIACGVPTVTLEGRYSRGRQTAGMLRILGLENWVARDQTDYVDKAVELAGSKEKQRQVSEQMLEHAPQLFDNELAIQSLENFYQRVTSSNGGL